MSFRFVRRALLPGLILLLVQIPDARPASPLTVILLKSRDLTPYNRAAQGVRRSLAAWNPTVQIHEMVLPGDEKVEKFFLDSLERPRPDLIVTIGTQATRAMMRRQTDIPVVFSLVLTAGEDGTFFKRRALNVTGAAMDIPVPVQFARLKEVIPDLRRVGVIFNPRVSGQVIRSAREAAIQANLELVEISVASEAQVMEEVSHLKGRVDGLWSVPDSTVFTSRSVDAILLQTLRDGIPFVGLSPSFVKAGALLSFSCDYEDVGAQSGEIAVEVLKGKSPARIPVVYPRRVSLFLNLNTARAIHLDISEKVQAESQVDFNP